MPLFLSVQPYNVGTGPDGGVGGDQLCNYDENDDDDSNDIVNDDNNDGVDDVDDVDDEGVDDNDNDDYNADDDANDNYGKQICGPNFRRIGVTNVRS